MEVPNIDFIGKVKYITHLCSNFFTRNTAGNKQSLYVHQIPGISLVQGIWVKENININMRWSKRDKSHFRAGSEIGEKCQNKC